MKNGLKRIFIKIRNRWGLSNSIRSSHESSVSILGNLLHTSIRVTGNSQIVIGEKSFIRKASIIVRGKNNRIDIEEGVYFSGMIELFGDGNTLIIGRNSVINGADLIVHNGTTINIGPNCLFSTQIDLRTTDSHFIFDSTGERINQDKDIFIGEHVWIGRLVSILKGSRIGNGSVIGSMSLVSGSISEEVIAVGVPARAIKSKISWKA